MQQQKQKSVEIMSSKLAYVYNYHMLFQSYQDQQILIIFVRGQACLLSAA